MWTRNRLEAGNANLIAPWNLQHRGCTQTRVIPGRRDEMIAGPSGRHAGSFPGYGAGLTRGGFQGLEAGLYRGGQLYPGFGIAMDPSDPQTWTRPVQFT
jgi:hypothetical protein